MRNISKFTFVFLTIFSYSQFLIAEEAKVDVIDLLNLGKQFENTKIILTPIKKTQSILKSSIAKIDNECCDENFPKKNEITEIKSILQDCLDTNCGKYMLPVFSKKKPPAKLIALRLVNKIDDLILENQNFRYEQLSKKLDVNRSKKLENEKDTKVLKENIDELEKENTKLKDTVDKMLKNYQTKIIKLEEKNKQLEEDFQKAYDMLPKRKQKEFSKK